MFVCESKHEFGSASCPTRSAFSSLAIPGGNLTDSRGSVISMDSNPSNSDRNSEKMEPCEKVSDLQITFASKVNIFKWTIFLVHLCNKAVGQFQRGQHHQHITTKNKVKRAKYGQIIFFYYGLDVKKYKLVEIAKKCYQRQVAKC